MAQVRSVVGSMRSQVAQRFARPALSEAVELESHRELERPMTEEVGSADARLRRQFVDRR